MFKQLSEKLRLWKLKNFCKSEKLGYIYFGNEKITFHQRHPIYQIIIRNEFANVIRDFINVKIT